MEVSILCSRLQHAKIFKDALSSHSTTDATNAIDTDTASTVFYTYTDFDQFWSEAEKGTTPLYLVDVERACESERSLAEHPAYVDGRMNIIFYYTQETLPLMSAVYSMHFLGEVDREAEDLPQKLSHIVGVLLARRKKERENGQLKAQLYKSENRFHKAVEQFQQELQRFEYQEFLTQFMRKIENQYDGHNFLTTLSGTMDESNFIKQYAFFELSESGQKLASPRLKGKKYYRLPSLWLGINHGSQGIQERAQGLAHQTATDCFRGEVVTLAPRAFSGELPRFLMYLKVDKHICHELDWGLLQSFLGGIYASSMNKKREPAQETTRFMSQWEFGDLLVEKGGHQESDGKVLTLDFERLLVAVDREEEEDSFEWQRFYREFVGLLEGDKRYDYSATSLGRWGMAFLVFEEDYKGLRAWLWELSQNFAYWKFFENPDSLLAQNLAPYLKTFTALRTDFFHYVAKRDRKEADRYLALTTPPPPPLSFSKADRGREARD